MLQLTPTPTPSPSFRAPDMLKLLHHKVEQGPLLLSKLNAPTPELRQACLAQLELGTGLGFWQVRGGRVSLSSRKAWEDFTSQDPKRQRAMVLSLVELGMPTPSRELSAQALGLVLTSQRKQRQWLYDYRASCLGLPLGQDHLRCLINSAGRQAKMIEEAQDLFLIKLAAQPGTLQSQEQLETLWAQAHGLPPHRHQWRKAFGLAILWGWLVPSDIIVPKALGRFEVNPYAFVHGRWRWSD